MARIRMLLIPVVAFAVFAHAMDVQAACAGDEIKLIAQLNGSTSQPLASGKAVYRKKGTLLRFTTEVEDLKGVANIRVVVNGKNVGTAPVINGTADLNLAGAAVPAVIIGSKVVVYDTATNKLVASGTF